MSSHLSATPEKSQTHPVSSLPLRRSRAALRSGNGSASARTILAALAVNLVITVAKLAAGLLSGSAALLAEAAHSFADSLNEVFLAISLHRGRRPADLAHPLGHGRERFLWAFMAAISSFLIGGCVSIGLAIWELVEGHSGGSLLIAWVVLAISFAGDGISLLQSMRQARREAREHRQSLRGFLVRASDPALRAVVVEDGAALIGVGLAAIGLVSSVLVGNAIPDALASLLIGILLAATAFGLARPLAEFLVGRSLPPDELRHLRALVDSAPVVEEVVAIQAVYSGPEEIIVAAKVRPVATLTVDALTRGMDELDQVLRLALAEVADVYVDITAYRLQTVADDGDRDFAGSGRGVQSASKNP